MKKVEGYGRSDQQTRFIQSRSFASIQSNPRISFQTIVNGLCGRPKGYCEEFSSIAHLLSILLVSMEKIGWIINRKSGRAVTVTIGSRGRDFAKPDSDEPFEAAGIPGVFLCVGYALCRV